MKKFGILTFHNANNYGAVLQAYALQEFLNNEIGKNCAEDIDYKCLAIRNQSSLLQWIKKQGVVSGVAHYPLIRLRISRISKFCKKHMGLSKKITNFEELKEVVHSNYRYIISGSDQIWNRNLTEEDTYLQNFHDENLKKISYAASFGIEELPDSWKQDYKKFLSNFRSISVREESAKEILENEFSIKAEVHVDPTLLLSANQWNKVACRQSNKRPFVLVYMVPYQQSVVNRAQEIAEKNNLKLIYVCRSLRKGNGIYKGSASVKEVIGLFRDADYVVTNSFHGTAFSIIYHKNFSVELNNSLRYNVRSAQLLKICGLEVNKKLNAPMDFFGVNWKMVDKALEFERDRTRDYFRSLE